MATQKRRPVGISDKEWELAQKTHQTPHILVGEQREIALQQNPGLGRQLLEEEIKLAKHQRLRQQSIGIRLAEEEVRRADRHWRYSGSTTVQDVAGVPGRVLEAAMIGGTTVGAVGITAALTRSAASVRKDAEARGFNLSIPERAIASMDEKVTKSIIEEGLASGRLLSPREVTRVTRGTSKTELNRNYGIPAVLRAREARADVTKAEVNEIYHRLISGSQMEEIHGLVSKVGEGSDASPMWSTDRRYVAQLASNRHLWSPEDLTRNINRAYESNLQKIKEGVPYRTYTSASRNVRDALMSNTTIKGHASHGAALENNKPFDELDSVERTTLNPIQQRKAYKRAVAGDVGVGTEEYVAKVTKSLGDVGELQKIHAEHPVTTTNFDNITAALEVRKKSLLDASAGIRKEISDLVAPREQMLFKQRAMARGKVGKVVAIGTAVVAGGLAINRAVHSRKLANDVEEYNPSMRMDDPSQRVKKSWDERRRKYGPSGESFSARY